MHQSVAKIAYLPLKVSSILAKPLCQSPKIWPENTQHSSKLKKVKVYSTILTKQQQQSIIPLCEVSYMDHMTPFGIAKNQSFRNIISLRYPTFGFVISFSKDITSVTFFLQNFSSIIGQP